MKTICPKCNGDGYHKERANIDPFFAIATLGLTALMDLSFRQDVECRVCDGNGYLND